MQNKHKKTLQRYLLRKLTLVMTISTLVMILLVGVFVNPQFVKQIHYQNQWIAYYISNSIMETVKRQTNVLESIHEMTTILPIELSGNEMGEYLEHIVSGKPFLKSVLIVDKNGKVVMTNTSNLNQISLDVTRNSWYVSDIADNEYVWSTIYLSGMT